MIRRPVYKKFKRIALWTVGILLFLFIAMSVFVNRFLEPLIRQKIHALIIQGSDSLYSYSLGDLSASFYGGSIEVENLQIKIDSSRYEVLESKGWLPAVTMQLDLKKGRLSGLSLFSLLFKKKIRISDIVSSGAVIRLYTHVLNSKGEKDKPLWASFQPEINSITVDRVKFDQLKLLYRNGDTAQSIKIQFDECDAVFEDLRIDSTAAMDTSRIGFSKNISLRIHDLKYRTNDSTYKMKAEWIRYSTRNRLLEIDSFKLQPTLEKDDFYRITGLQKTLFFINFANVKIAGTQLKQLLNSNTILADSAIFDHPEINIYLDKTVPGHDFKSKIGYYPHQLLKKVPAKVSIGNVVFRNAAIVYSEKNSVTGKEGRIVITEGRLDAQNITNDSLQILKNNKAWALVKGKLLGSPASLRFTFYLDDPKGRFDVAGSMGNISAQQVNTISLPLANVQVNSLHIDSLNFFVRGEDMSATADVRAGYRDLSLTFLSTNESGATTVRNFLTKMLNRMVLVPQNPAPDGTERKSFNRVVMRLTTQSFFGLIWKTIFAGIQDIVINS